MLLLNGSADFYYWKQITLGQIVEKASVATVFLTPLLFLPGGSSGNLRTQTPERQGRALLESRKGISGTWVVDTAGFCYKRLIVRKLTWYNLKLCFSRKKTTLESILCCSFFNTYLLSILVEVKCGHAGNFTIFTHILAGGTNHSTL